MFAMAICFSRLFPARKLTVSHARYKWGQISPANKARTPSAPGHQSNRQHISAGRWELSLRPSLYLKSGATELLAVESSQVDFFSLDTRKWQRGRIRTFRLF